MKPYYERDGITLYCADCNAVSVPCDLIVTDPPYGQEFQSGRGGFDKIVGDLAGDVEGTLDRLRHALGGLRRGRHLYVFGDKFDFTALPLSSVVELIWDKEVFGLGDLSIPWGPQHERVTFAVYETSKANRDKGYGALTARLRRGSILRSLRAQSGRAEHHPTEKPIDILRQMIESSSVLGEIVYDPFAGSGSTLIAAAIEGRKAVGCEITENYCEVAAKRLDETLGRLF